MKNVLKHYKYIHICLHKDDVKFCYQFKNRIAAQDEFFNADEHCFITPWKATYDSLLPFPNVYLITEKRNLINYCYKYCDNIIVHSLDYPVSVILLTKKKAAEKVIWRTWGHDVLQIDNSKKSSITGKLKQYLRNFIIQKYINKCRSFRAIAIANVVDELNIQKVFGNVRTIILNYAYESQMKEKMETIYNEMLNKRNKKTLKIMVGHSGWPYDEHINILNKLLAYKNEDIIISLVLNYGDKIYIEKVKKYASVFGEKVEFIEEFMEFNDYARYISSVDIAILATKHSNALGNYSLLSYFNKKIYISSNGIMAEVLEKYNCPVNSIDNIGKIDFNDFSSYKKETAEKMKKILGEMESDYESGKNMSQALKSLEA